MELVPQMPRQLELLALPVERHAALSEAESRKPNAECGRLRADIGGRNPKAAQRQSQKLELSNPMRDQLHRAALSIPLNLAERSN